MTTAEMTVTQMRERREELTAEAIGLGAKYNGDLEQMTAAESIRLVEIANEITPLAADLVKHDRAHGTIEDSKKWLMGMGADPAIADIGDDENDKLASASGIVAPDAHMTLARRFVESEAYQSFAKNTDVTGAIPAGWKGQSEKFDIGGSLITASQAARKVKNIVTTGDFGPAGGDIIDPTRLPTVDESPLPTPFLIDLCTRLPVSGEGWKYAKLVSKTNSAAFTAEATTTDPELPVDQTPANSYKPMSDLTWTSATGTVGTIAHWIPITRQAAADAPQVVALIQAFLIRGLASAIDSQLLSGDDVGENLRGILNTTNPYTNVHSVSVGAGDRFNAILTAMGQIASAREDEFMPNAIVINKTDYFSTDFLGSQDANDNWKFGGPAASPGALNPWGLRAIVTNHIPAGTQLIGDFRWALIGDRQGAQLHFADQHEDFFVKNLLVILAEQRLGFELMAEEAFAQVVA